MAAARRHVRAVSPDERKPREVLSLVEAVESGDYLQILLAQRRDIVKSLPEEKGQAKAALHRQLSVLSRDIKELSAVLDGQVSVVAGTEDAVFDGSTI